MLDLNHVLEGRFSSMDFIVKQGVIPGELDTYELQQMTGRIKELEFIIKLLAANNIAAGISEFIEG